MSTRLLKLILYGVLTALLFMTGIRQSHASHAMGADLTYECLGGNTYRLRVSFYRDCIGIAAPSSVVVNVRSVSCSQNFGVTCNPVAGTGQEVNALCPTALTTCNGGVFTGIEEWVYEGIVTLPMQCNDWTFSWTHCCRNAAINTISSPGSSTFYIYGTLDNTQVQCNNSPTFTNKPVPFACLGQTFQFNHGAIDADGDSLVYSLVTPRQTAGSTVNYIAPYSATNPIASTPPLQFNSVTGDIMFTPTMMQNTVMAVLVQEYRNGVLIGTVVRDIQVTVVNCNNSLPTLSGINGTNDFDTTVCANVPLCFDIFSSDTDPGQVLNLTWNNGIDSGSFITSAANHPTGTFCWTPLQHDASTSPYCFTVRVNDDACPYIGAQTYSYCVTVNGVVVDAGPDQNIACSDLATVSANVITGTAPYTYLWSNGFTNPVQTVGIGTYIVTVTDANGCQGQDTIEVISAFEPVAAFTYTAGCLYNPVQFTDASSTPGGTIITSWTWDFGDGTTSGLQNPQHTYSSAGTFNVTLVIENSVGCIDTVIQPVTVDPLPVPSFSFGAGCAGSEICFTNTSSPAADIDSVRWYFGNGSSSTASNPCVTYVTPGTYDVSLIIYNDEGCGDTVTQQVTIHPVPVANFSFSGSFCEDAAVAFIDSSTGAVSWSWQFGDGDSSNQQNPVHIYNSSGTYYPVLTVTNQYGCTDTYSATININVLPVASLGPDVSVCIGSTITLTASGGVAYSWNPGGATTGSINISPSADTMYTVTVTDANGCTDMDSINVNVDPLPVATVSPNQAICAGQSVTLTASGGVTYNWNPTGNTSGTITVSPSSSTTYAVDVIDANGCQATAFVNVTVNPEPVITLPPGVFTCSGISATLDAGPGGTSYQWNTGATTQTISINQQGVYTVTVTNQFGCSETASTTVTVGGQIVTNSNNVFICQGQTTVLNAGYAGSTYLWSTGATTQTITVGTAGVYQVTVTDGNGCSGVIATTVNVNPSPVADFTPSDGCINSPVSFTDISTINGSTITSWNWNFGDGTFSQQQNPVHTYNSQGNYPVTLTVTTADGCSSSLTDTVRIYNLPQAEFTYNHGCQYSPIQLTDQSSTAYGNIVSWNWDFGDGTTSTLQNPVHEFTITGTNVVTLTITTAGGCTDTRSHNIQIFPSPLLSFTLNPSIVCDGAQVSITNTSSTSNGAINAWNWNFGDGTTSSAMHPNHVYNGPGTYNITLIAGTSHGCSDTASQSITVSPLPVANAGNNVWICRGNSTTLTASGGISYEWSPGGQTTQAISVTPNNTTTYYVTVTNAAGCTAIDSVTVTIKNLPNANAGVDRSICAGNSTTLTATGGVSYAWSPGGQTTNTITVSPATTTQYIVTVTGANGCPKEDTVNVVVNALPVASAGPDQVICSGTTATLSASGGTSYYWSHNGATTSTVYVSPASSSTYVVTVTDANGCTDSDAMDITVNPTPVVQLNTPGFFCAGSSIMLDAGNPGAQYLWSPTGQTTQTISVSVAGTYTVEVTNAFGCVGTSFSDIFEGGTGLVVNATNVQMCIGNSTVLNAGNPGSVYLWSTGQTSQTISVNAAGVYNVTVTDTLGCQTEFANNVVVHPLPDAGFTANNVCQGSPVLFADTSRVTGSVITGWNWNFGNGQLGNSSNAFINYATPGDYTVSLVVTSGFGCVDSASQTVSIYPPPVADFSANMVCHEEAMLFNDLSTVSLGTINYWYWDFNNGAASFSQNPVYNYPVEGAYDVTLIVGTTLGCRDTVVRTVNVNPKPLASFGAPEVCEGDSMSFINTSSINNGAISDYTWDFGDGTGSTLNDPKHLYAGEGTFTVTLIAGSDLGCMDTVARQVIVNDKPVADFTTAPVCGNEPVLFNDNSSVNGSTVNGWSWAFGDATISNAQNPVHIYSYPGSYNVNLVAISGKGCRDTVQRAAMVNPVPVAGFTAQSACTNAPIQFNDISTVSAGAINSWTWSFGDGTTSTAQHPLHVYSQPGTYQVLLVVGCATGCIDSIRQSVNVFPVPVADFTASPVCLNTQTAFYDQSQVSGGGNFSYSWNFGDGAVSNAFNPSHMYNTAGNYNVMLNVTTPYGCANSVVKTVTVHDNPVASFTAASACEGEFATLNDGSVISSGSITSWNWTLGDGAVVQAQNVTHIYNSAGVYPVTISVMSQYGCSASYTDSITIWRKPTPVILAVNGCVNDPISLSDTSTGNHNIISAWEWYFDNGTGSVSQNASVTFNTPGQHMISLTTTNINGCRGFDTASVNMNPLPVAGFNAGSSCAGSAMSFYNTSTISTGSISGYSWNFGDGSGTSVSSNPTHIYAQAGNYTVTLIAISEFGCLDTFTRNVRVNPLPVPAFTSNAVAGCGPVFVQFNDASTISPGNIIAWAWDFGDGGTSPSQNPSHMYTASGSYSVSLTVTSDSGCTETYTAFNHVTVFPAPIADFEPDPYTQSIMNPVFEFNNLSISAVTYAWTFGDGGTSTQFEPSHTYADTGHYAVTLVVTNTFGCIDTIRKQVVVEPEFTVFIPNAFTPNDDGHNEGFNVKGWYIEHVNMNIYNRWGDLVFHSEGKYNDSWLGSVINQNQPAPEGVYVYDILVKDVWGKTHQRNGLVNLVR